MIAGEKPINKITPLTISDLPGLLVGVDTEVPTLNGTRRYINFDNAASTPTFVPIVEAVNSFLRFYSNVHRGTGFKSQLSSWAFEQLRDIVAEFVSANLKRQVVIFTKNSTDAINKLANRIEFSDDDVVITTLMEHHSNELPWRRVAKVKHVGLNPDGTINKDHFLSQLKTYGSKIKLVAVSGASNVTGYINDIDFFAKETHRIGAKIVVDAAQLAPHRPINMKPNDSEHCLDYLVFSAHKMYAPFGIGVLISDRETFERGAPDTVGGGAVDIVTLEEAYWTDLPDKEEAGTPDIIGVIALAKAVEMFGQIGWENVIKHEAELTAYALERLMKIPGVKLYGDTDLNRCAERLGVVPFNVGDLPHALVAAILSYEGAIGVRAGCFCAHTYVKELLGVTEAESHRLEAQILARDRSEIPGTVRASFGIYNTTDEVDALVELIRKIARGEYVGKYSVNKEKGEYFPAEFAFDFDQYFKI